MKRFVSRYILALMAFGLVSATAGWSAYIFSEEARLRQFSDAELFAQCDPETDACELASCAGIWDAKYQLASEQGVILDFEGSPEQFMTLAVSSRREMALDFLLEVRRRSQVQHYTFRTDEQTRSISDHNMISIECWRAFNRKDVDRSSASPSKPEPSG